MIKELVRKELSSHGDTISEVINCLDDDIAEACELAVKTLKRDRKYFLLGTVAVQRMHST